MKYSPKLKKQNLKNSKPKKILSQPLLNSSGAEDCDCVLILGLAYKHEGHWLEIVLQVLGMSLGVFIMLIIALYEHDLKGVFSESHHDH